MFNIFGKRKALLLTLQSPFHLLPPIPGMLKQFRNCHQQLMVFKWTWNVELLFYIDFSDLRRIYNFQKHGYKSYREEDFGSFLTPPEKIIKRKVIRK